ncbi:hypothetical protein PAMP_003556 [Pampus punctatissimus]
MFVDSNQDARRRSQPQTMRGGAGGVYPPLTSPPPNYHANVTPSPSMMPTQSPGNRKHGTLIIVFEYIPLLDQGMIMYVREWVSPYAMVKYRSLLELVGFLFTVCVCAAEVEYTMQKTKQPARMINPCVYHEAFKEECTLQFQEHLCHSWRTTWTWWVKMYVLFLLVLSQHCNKLFGNEYNEFNDILPRNCTHTAVLSVYNKNDTIRRDTHLSSSFFNIFVNTFVLGPLDKLISASSSSALGVKASRQCGKTTRTTRQKSAPQVERIQKKITELQEKKAEIEGMMDIIFKGIFLKRYRDVLPEIRSICMEELGVWMKLYSSVFLNDSYLKYMGWMMHDKIPDVRLKCVLGLQGLYGDPLLLPKLDLFTSRFKERMISMTLDKDNEVAVQTMKLLVLISKTSDDILSPKDYKQLLQFVYSSQRPIAATAGELLFSRLLNTSAAASDNQDGINEEEDHKEQTSARLKALLQFYQESELHKHVVYLVDSLWDCGGGLLKDWPTLTSILMQDPSSQSAEQVVLVEILVASVRQASEGPVLAGRSGAKKVMSAREKKVQIDDCCKLTEHLLPVLPKLLSKFSGSSDIVASLMKIPQYFLPECLEAGNAQVASSLMAEMGAVLDLHSGPAVLEAAARTYLSLCGEETAWCSTARPARDALVQGWVDQLTALLEDSFKDNNFSADEEKTGEILAVLTKLRAFHNCHDLSQWNLFELLSPLLSAESSQGAPPPQVLLEVLPCLCYSMLWSLNTSGESLTSREKAVAQRLQLRLFSERSHHYLSHSDHSVRLQAFLGVCDVLTAHSYQLHVWDPSTCGPLLYTPSPKLQKALLTFVCVHVFVGADSQSSGETSAFSANSEVERLEDLHKRRNLLAAYCKLIVHKVLEMSMAAEIFMYYMKYYNDFGDIIKEMMYRTRQIDKIESARTLVLCLQQLFVRLKREQESGGRPHPGVQTFTSIKELARRFALTFGDLVKFRECVVMIHRNGIEFVFQEFSQIPETPTPPYLSYLTILGEFSSKLLKPDKKTVFSYLQKHTAEHIVNLREECWQPLIYYRASLLAAADGEDAVSYVSSDRKPHLPNRSPFSKQKLEGSKSSCPFSPVEPKVSKVHRSGFSPSHQEKTSDLDPFSVPVELPTKRPTDEGSVLSTGNETDDDTVEVEV